MPEGDRRLTKNEKRRQRQKEKAPTKETAITEFSGSDETKDVDVEYVSADFDSEISELGDGNIIEQFRHIFKVFATPDELSNENLITDAGNDGNATGLTTADNSVEITKLSKKKKKLSSRLSVAELKQLINRPDVVEAHDVTASDPRFLVYLKSYRNSVPVPRHWCAKRKYLQGKRGIEKPPFQLPEFIAETGIAKIRDTVIEQETIKKSKQKARDKLQPKMGKIDIDYQVLHDAFFKYQTKPRMTIHGKSFISNN